MPHPLLPRRKSFGTLLLALLSCLPLLSQTDPYKARRDKLMSLTDQGLVILVNSGGNDYVATNGENMNFYYLTGTNLLGATLVMEGKTGKATLYKPIRPWDPPVDSIKGLPVKSTEDFSKALVSGLRRHPMVWMEMNQLELLEKAESTVASITSINNVTRMFTGLRLIKDETEINLIRKSAEIGAKGLCEMMKAAEPGMNEKDLDLILDFNFKKLGSTAYSFQTQAASGPNSTLVHYGLNNRKTEPGDMMVFDIGPEYEYYTCDISRSFPISGKFTKEQREIYQIVLDAQVAAIRNMKPGISQDSAFSCIEQILNDGLEKLGLITDRTQKWQERIWLMHGWGHSIGLQVHDISKGNTGEEPMIPGMIFTVEPGLYFPAGYLDRKPKKEIPDEEWNAFVAKVAPILKKYANIGVRIEDDVLITPTGHEILTSGVPKEISEIEALMKQSSPFSQIR